MIQYVILSLMILLELFAIIYVFDIIQLEKNTTYYKLKNNFKAFVEFLLLISVVYFTSYKFIENNKNTIGLIYILISVILWLIISYVLPLYNVSLYNSNDNNTNDNKYYDSLDNHLDSDSDIDSDIDNHKNKDMSNSRIAIFSKYIKRNNRDFIFEKLHGNYNKKDEEYILEQYKKQNNNQKGSDKNKDYSKYNGYNSNHICYNCSCLKRDNGYIFCGKFIPGFGTIGCSERWGCRNCKKCKQGYNNTNDKYECKNCKCIETKNGTICGKRGRLDGGIHKCDNSCERCENCKSSSLQGDGVLVNKPKIYKYVKPISTLNNIIVNNVSNIDMEKVFR